MERRRGCQRRRCSLTKWRRRVHLRPLFVFFLIRRCRAHCNVRRDLSRTVTRRVSNVSASCPVLLSNGHVTSKYLQMRRMSRYRRRTNLRCGRRLRTGLQAHLHGRHDALSLGTRRNLYLTRGRVLQLKRYGAYRRGTRGRRQNSRIITHRHVERQVAHRARSSAS